MKKYTFFLGLNDKDTKRQHMTTNLAQEEVIELVAKYLGGGTISIVSGVFKHEDGTIVKENTIKIETLGFNEKEIYEIFAGTLRDKFNQESVLMEVSEVSEYFI